MAKKKEQTYYNILNLLETKAEYNMLLGQRANGKSYSVKEVAIWEAYHESDYFEFHKNKKTVRKDRFEFGYLRRWGDDIKARTVESYFADTPISKLTEGEYTGIEFYRGEIFFTKMDEEDDKPRRCKRCGTTFSLNGCTHYKSLSYPTIGNIIFEEFVTDNGYLPNETRNLFDIVSTISRRDDVRVFLVGNTISRLCPYFDEWELTHVLEQKPGTIDIYHQPSEDIDEETGDHKDIVIAVEYCATVSGTGKMFFGQKAKMISTGVWESEVYPHLEAPFREYKVRYQILYMYRKFGFIINLLVGKDKKPFVFVYPRKKPNMSSEKHIKRIICEDFSTDQFITQYLTKVTKYDTLVMELINDGKIVYSDNLTGTEFNQLRKDRGRL